MSVSSPEDRRPIALALAGGGPQGAVYEIGALHALEEALDGLLLHECDMYVGVSAGAFLGSCLVNGITVADLCRAVLRRGANEHFFSPATFVTPAFSEWAVSGARLPRLFVRAIQGLLRDPDDATTMGSLSRLAEALPVAVFQNEPIRAYLERVFAMPGHTDDFRELRRRLIVVATDLDSGTPALFGTEGLDHVPISEAVQASSALPGLYPPVEIDGRHYVDGVLLKTLHASVALEDGAGLVLCVNPIVPVDTARAVEKGVMRRGKLLDRGLPGILSQTFRTLVHSRMRAGFASYGRAFEGQDIVLVEPRRDDYRMFFTNIFSFRTRKSICEYAYAATRRDLLAGYDKIAPKFERHGLRLRRDVLEDDARTMWDGLEERRSRRTTPVADRLGSALDRVEEWIDRDA